MYSPSYFPEYYYARDHIPGATRISWPLGHRDLTARNETGYNIPLQQSSADHYMAYCKELMKQTMLKQEAVFKYQVHEMHRLYKRQKELMNHQRRYIQVKMSQIEQPDTTNPLLKIENGQEEVKFGKRMLDLELSGDQYINREEEEKNVPQIKVDSFRTCIFDLNEPFQLDDVESSLCGMVNIVNSVDLDLNSMPTNCPSDSEIVASQEKPMNIDKESVIEESVKIRDLEAPLSPKNKECSPPRGETENMKLFQLSKEEELDKIAAETMILISSSHSFKNLEWFSEVVSSVAGKTEENVEKTGKEVKDDSLLIGKIRRRRRAKIKALHTLGVGLGSVIRRKRNSGENVLEQFMNLDAKDVDLRRYLKGWRLEKGQRKARSARSCFKIFLL